MKFLYYLIKIILTILTTVFYLTPIIYSLIYGLNLYTLIIYTLSWILGIICAVFTCAIKLDKKYE